MRVPHWVYDTSGLLDLRFAFRVSDEVSKASAGLDNLKIIAHYTCNLCMPEELIAVDNFQDSSTALDGWVNGRLSTTSGLTQYLGGYSKGDDALKKDPVKFYFVPLEADTIRVEFDLYEQGTWKGQDSVYVYINGIRIDLGVFSATEADDSKQGIATATIQDMTTYIPWRSDSVTLEAGKGSNQDPEEHRVVLEVPYDVPLYDGGLLDLHFATRIDSDVGTKAGFDNVRITAIYDCGPCVPDFLIAREDFEGLTPTLGWKNGKTSTSPPLTTFLGRYDYDSNSKTGMYDPVKTFKVPPTANSITLEFDFYEIDKWQGEDCFYAYVNNETIELNYFAFDKDEISKGNTTKNGIVWSSSSLGPPKDVAYEPTVDQKHHVTATVPSSIFQDTGELTLQFYFAIFQYKNVTSGGVDNIQITANFDCLFPSMVPSEAPSRVVDGTAFLSPPVLTPNSPTSTPSPTTPIEVRNAPPAGSTEECPTYMAEVTCGDMDGVPFYVNATIGWQTCEWLRNNLESKTTVCPPEKCSPAYFFCPETCGRCCMPQEEKS